MGVNAAAFVHYYLRAPVRQLRNLVLPVSGFLICLVLWWNLSPRALVFGLAWMALGIAYGAWKTRGFREHLMSFAPSADTSE